MFNTLFERWKGYSPSFGDSVIHSLVAGVILCGCWYLITRNLEIAAFFGGFAVWSKIADKKTINVLKLQLRRENQVVHCQYCRDLIDNAVAHAKKKMNNSLPYSLDKVESSLTEIWKCCTSTDEKERFNIHKSTVGNTKTIIQKSAVDLSIRLDYAELIVNLEQIKSELMTMCN